MHPATLQARFDQQLVGTLDDAAADRVAGSPEVGVADLLQATAEIAMCRADWSALGRSVLRQPARQLGDNPRCIPAAQFLTLRGQPGLGTQRLTGIACLGCRREIAHSMGKVQDPYCIMALQIEKALAPRRTIDHPNHPPGAEGPTSMVLDRRQVPKALSIDQPCEITQVGRQRLAVAASV